MFNNDYVVILDVDGTLTDGSFYSNDKGKFLKKFGADDWDALKILHKFTNVHFISADKKGFSIVQNRLEKEMNFKLDLVTHLPKERWIWMASTYPQKKIFYIADGIFDYYSLKECFYGICPMDSLKHVRNSSKMVINRVGRT
jgi:3-deoxy-D-manno-octulosonate 8-phosphate phosphatase (KDO 8-P phosphatase)